MIVMNKINKIPSGCWTQLRRKKRVDKQTSTPRATESCFLSPLPFETSKIVLRGTFSLENQQYQPSPPAKLQLDYSHSGNPKFTMSSNQMNQPSNVREQIQAPYVNSSESSLHTDDVACLPNFKNITPPTVKRVAPPSPPAIDHISDSRIVGDDVSTDPRPWSNIPTQPSLTQTQQSDPALIPPMIGPSPATQFCPNHKHCFCSICAGVDDQPIHCIPTTTIPYSVYHPSTVPVMHSTTPADNNAFTSHKIFVIPQTHTDFYPVYVPDTVRSISASGYLVECGSANVPVQIPADSVCTGIRRSRCRCHSVSCCRPQWPCEYGREPDYMTMNISPPARNCDTNQHHNTNDKLAELDSHNFVEKNVLIILRTHTQ